MPKLIKPPKIQPVEVPIPKRKYTKKLKKTKLTWLVPLLVTSTLLTVGAVSYYVIGYYELRSQLAVRSEKLEDAVVELTTCYGEKKN